MKEFAFGTDEQFQSLKDFLEDCQCHVYRGCKLPDGCHPAKARIGFEKAGTGGYVMYIDRGIQTENDHADFRNLLEQGELKFICFEDMVSFLRGLQGLFGTEQDPQDLYEDHKEPAPEPSIPVYDPQKVHELLENKVTGNMVWPEEIAGPLKKRIYGQDDVIDEIVRKIIINRLSLQHKLLVMTLIGPTATGKSETAKSLAGVLSDVYKTPYGYIEVAGNEFMGEHSVQRFFGAPPGYVGYGEETILEPVRKNPRHVIVINEIEKADTKLLTGLMEAIDTGHLGMADNSKPIDLNQCILFFTSNIPIDMVKYEAASRFKRAEMCRDAFTRHCGRPEISGKIGNFVVFHPLSEKATLEIVVKFIQEELANYDLQLVHVDEELLLHFLEHQTKYGARGIRELVSTALGDQLLQERNLEKFRNQAVSLGGTIENLQFRIEEKQTT